MPLNVGSFGCIVKLWHILGVIDTTKRNRTAMKAELTMGQQIWMGHNVNSCDPLTRPLTDDLVNQISRTISITSGIIPIKHATF